MTQSETKQVGRPTRYDPDFGEKIIEIMSEGFSLVAAASCIGVGRTTVYEWRDKHPEFAKMLEIAAAKRQHVLEKDLLNAKEGPVVTSRIFALKNASPDWREKKEVEHSGSIGTMDLSKLTDEELAILKKVVPEG